MDPCYDYHVVGTIHNFGVFKNSGKKVILQIDFKTNKVNLIKRGTIQYKCDFDDLSYDSEEGVLFCIKIGGKQTELTAENLEEKTAICRLLSIVQSTAVDLVKREARINSLDRDEDLVVRTRAASVLKEGVLEKKGNATIQIWAKRKVKVTPGMFSYFKTDEQTALNVVPLKPNQYTVKSVGHYGFNIIFPKRTYYFRLVSASHSPTSQTERDEWISAFSNACLEKRRTVVDFEGCRLEPSHQPSQKYLLNVGSFRQSDEALYYHALGGEGNNKNDEAMKDSANQTNFGEKLSDIIPTSVTKERPKLSSGEKQPLVAVKSLITEENEEEVELRDGKRFEDEDALQLKNPLYDVVKDLRYSSSEDNMSSGHEEMICPEGDYAYPEDVFENQHEEGNRKSDAGCPTYDEIGDQIVPFEENMDQDKEEDTMEDALYSKVNTKTKTHDSGNKKQSCTRRKETPIYSVSVKRRKSKKESQQQRGSLPPPPPPPPLSLISPLALPSEQISGSLSANTDEVKCNRKKSLDRPNSHPPPPPISEDRRSASSATSKSIVSDTTKQPKSPVEGSPNVFLSPSDRRSASSFSSGKSHSSAGKSGVLSEDEQGQFAEKHVSESSRERLSSTQSSESSKSDMLITNTEQEYSKSETDSLITLFHQPTTVLDEKVDLLNNQEHPLPATELESSNFMKQDEIEDKEECPTKEEHIVTSSDCDTEKTNVHHGAVLSVMGSSKLNPSSHNLPQWPPVSEVTPPPPPPPPPTQFHFLSKPPTIPQAPAPPPVPQTNKSHSKKLRTLHWSKLNKSQVKSSFWKHASDRKNDINKDLIMEHFCIVDENQPTRTAEQTFAGTKLLLDATRARNLGIILTGLKAEGARHIREVINSVTEDEFFPAEKLTTIRRYQPTSDDIELFKLYSDKKSTLDPVDRFMCELCEIEYIGTRLDLILLLWDFPRQLRCTHESLEELSQACSDLKTNTHLVQLMEYILAVGNIMNSSHKTHGFPLTSLRMFMDMRGKTTDFTFSHFLVVLLEEKDPEIIKWTSTMNSVIRCKDINIKALVTEVEVLKSDLTKLKKNLKHLKSKIKKPNEMETDFLHKAQHKLVDFENSMNSLEKESTNIQTTYRHLLEYFGEVSSLPSNELFSILSDFAVKFRKAIEDIDRKKRYQTLHHL